MTRAFLVVATLSLTACATPFPNYAVARPGATAVRFPTQPEGTKAALRGVLTFAGMELPMTLRVWRLLAANGNEPSLRIIAGTDMGGTAFHVVQHDGAVTVIQRSEMLPEPMLRDGLVGDLKHSFTVAIDSDRAVTHESGQPALLREDGIRRALFWSSTPGGPIDRIDRGVDGALTSTTALTWDQARPTGVEIQNTQFDYTLELETLEWEPAALSANTFSDRAVKSEVTQSLRDVRIDPAAGTASARLVFARS